MSFARYQWHIFRANLDPVTGSEQRGIRPVLVVSNEDYNQLMPVVTVLPLTSRKPGRQIYPNEILLPKSTASLTEDSIVMAHQVRTISKARLTFLYGAIQSAALKEGVRQALKVHLTLD
jgi:mRNA interferase MazF